MYAPTATIIVLALFVLVILQIVALALLSGLGRSVREMAGKIHELAFDVRKSGKAPEELVRPAAADRPAAAVAPAPSQPAPPVLVRAPAPAAPFPAPKRMKIPESLSRPEPISPAPAPS